MNINYSRVKKTIIFIKVNKTYGLVETLRIRESLKQIQIPVLCSKASSVTSQLPIQIVIARKAMKM